MIAVSKIAASLLGLAAASALVVGLGACSSDTAAPQDGSVSPDDSESQSEAPTNETPSPSDDAWHIAPAGIGPFEIGMRYADALTVPDADVSEICEGVAEVTVPDGDDVTMWVAASEGDPASILSEISVSAPADMVEGMRDGPVTDEGIGLGSSVDELTNAYPDVRELDDTGVPERVMYYVKGEGGGIIFTTTADADVIWQISVTTGEIPAYEPCA